MEVLGNLERGGVGAVWSPPGTLLWDKKGPELSLTPHASGYRLESGMQNLSIHTKTTSGYSGECPGPWRWRVGSPGGQLTKAVDRVQGEGLHSCSWQNSRVIGDRLRTQVMCSVIKSHTNASCVLSSSSTLLSFILHILQPQNSFHIA